MTFSTQTLVTVNKHTSCSVIACANTNLVLFGLVLQPVFLWTEVLTLLFCVFKVIQKGWLHLFTTDGSTYSFSPIAFAKLLHDIDEVQNA